MNSQRAVGIVLLLLGVALFVIGLNASDSPADRWSNFFTGHFTETTVWYLVGGVALAAVGLATVLGRWRMS
jgi:succinate dehydrogenase hydrophobic anchor subunit